MLERAAAGAARGDLGAGAFVHRANAERIAAALVLEPEVDAAASAIMLLVAQLAAGDAVTSIAPPETEVGHDWPSDLFVNEATCGVVEGTMPSGASDAVPRWLAVGVSWRLRAGDDPGADPGRTALHEELGELDAMALLEALGRSWVLWLHRWEEEGPARIGREWSARRVERARPGQGDGGAGPESGERVLGLGDGGDLIVASDGGTRALALLDAWGRT